MRLLYVSATKELVAVDGNAERMLQTRAVLNAAVIFAEIK